MEEQAFPAKAAVPVKGSRGTRAAPSTAAAEEGSPVKKKTPAAAKASADKPEKKAPAADKPEKADKAEKKAPPAAKTSADKHGKPEKKTPPAKSSAETKTPTAAAAEPSSPVTAPPSRTTPPRAAKVFPAAAASPVTSDSASTAAATSDASARGADEPAPTPGTVHPAEVTPSPALVVRPDESPWTVGELDAVREDLNAELPRIGREVEMLQSSIADVLRDSGDGAGDDQADTGSKAFEREQEMGLLANTRESLFQTERALARIDDGSYGTCESCGNAIGKLRLQAFPRATLCVACKQQQERR
jgi:DnaK suppressor protein